MDCEFEEKQYEEPMNAELAGRRIYYAPGQILENVVAIDAAILTRNQYLSGLWGTQNPWLFGTYLRPELWDSAKELLDSNVFPRLKANLFIQYKRPEYMRLSTAAQYSHWQQPYYRYDIEKEQQDILCKLEKNVASDALVLYSCASFWERSKLWEFLRHRELVKNSNFVKPSSLTSHTTYTFINNSNKGMAFSDPSTIDSVNLFDEIERIRQEPARFDSNTRFLSSLSVRINNVVAESSASFREQYYSLVRSREVQGNEFGASIIRILLFTFMANIWWGIIY